MAILFGCGEDCKKARRAVSASLSVFLLGSFGWLPIVPGSILLQAAQAVPSDPIHLAKDVTSAQPKPAVHAAGKPGAPARPASAASATSATADSSDDGVAENTSANTSANKSNTQTNDAGTANVPKSLADAVQLNAKVQSNVLEGRVESGDRISPFLEGSVQTIPKGTKMELTLTSYINSEVSQKGDEVFMKVSADVPNGKGVAVPGGWYAHGFVTGAQGHQNMHRNGFVEIEFDKLVSPDGHTEVDFPAKLSTKDGVMTSTLKEVAFGSKCTTVGAVGGAILSVQLTGIGGAVATHGISVGVGAGVGAALGILGALKRQGKAESLYGGDDVKLTITEPIMMPGFKAELLPSAQKVPVLKDMKISVNKVKFLKDPSGDAQSRLLDVDMTVDNHTKKTYSPRQLQIIDDRGHVFSPWVGENLKALMQKIGPEQSERIDVLYEVNSGKRKYWLSLRETSTGAELSRVPINID